VERAERSIASVRVLAVASLALGAAVYLFDRERAIWFAPAVVDGLRVALPAGLGWFTPSALHAFGFALLTALAGDGSRRHGYALCTLWVGIELAMELVQHPALLGFLRSSVAGDPAERWVNLALAGTFDPADLAAACAGGMLACAVVATSFPGSSHA
jgi:hypothetical protein